MTHIGKEPRPQPIGLLGLQHLCLQSMLSLYQTGDIAASTEESDYHAFAVSARHTVDSIVFFFSLIFVKTYLASYAQRVELINRCNIIIISNFVFHRRF